MLKRAVTLIGTRLGSGLLVLAYMTLFVRSSTPAELGVAAWCLSTTLLTSILLSCNVEAGAIRFLTRYRSEQNQIGATAFIRFSRLLVLGMFTVIGSAALLCVWLGFNPVDDIPLHVLAAMLVTALVVASARVTMRHATAFDAVLQGALPVSLCRPVVMCLVFGGFYILEQPITLEVFVYTLLLGEAVGFLVVRFFVGRILSEPLTADSTGQTSTPASKGDIQAFMADKSNWRAWVSTGVFFVPVLLIRDNLRDIIIIAATVGLLAEDLGVLLIAYSLFGLIYYAVKAVDMSVGSRLAQALSDSATQKAERYLAIIASTKVLFVLMGIGGIIVLGDWVLQIFGPDYVSALPVLLALMVIPAADALFGAPYVVLNVKGRSETVFFLSLCGAAGIFLTTLVAGLILPLQSVVLASGFAYFVQQGLACRIAFLQTDVDPSVLNVLRFLRKDASTAPQADQDQVG